MTCWRASDRLALTDKVNVAEFCEPEELDDATATVAALSDTGNMRSTASDAPLRRKEDMTSLS